MNKSPNLKTCRGWGYVDYVYFIHTVFTEGRVCARLAQLVRSPTANQEVSGSIPGLVEG